MAALQLKRDAPAIPGLGCRRELAREPVGGGDRRAGIALQQVQLQHCLENFRVRLTAFDGLFVFLERFLEIPLLAQGTTEGDMRARRSLLTVTWRRVGGPVAFERQVRLRANQ